MSHHDREDDGSHSGLEDPQQSQAEDLDKGEEVNLPQGNVSQVNQVWLMFCGHQKKFKTIHKLQKSTEIYNKQWVCGFILYRDHMRTRFLVLLERK